MRHCYFLGSTSPDGFKTSFSDIINNDKYYTYKTRKFVSSFGEWSKVTVSANELKSEIGTMSGWDNAICITVNSEEKLLINSLLWI